MVSGHFYGAECQKGIAARQLARDLGVDKDTAWYLQMRIRIAMRKTEWLLAGILEAGKALSGRDPENKAPDPPTSATHPGQPIKG